MAAASGKTRLQQLFQSYDTSGDGTLSVEEMEQVFEALGIKGSSYIFKKADKNKDGQLQVHEFIAWLTKKDPKVSIEEKVSGGAGSIEATVTNTNTKMAKKFFFKFTKCENVEFSEGRTVSMVLQPGEQKTQRLLTVTGEPCNYAYELATRAEYSGLPDDPDAFKDSEFPHDVSSVKGQQKEFPVDLWVRARMLGDPNEATLFDEIKPQDIKQGMLGDCWLMASFCAMASHPKLVKKLFESNFLTQDGKYTVWLYDAGPHQWVSFVLDEFVPCRLVNGKPRPMFAKPMGEEIWALLLEKAFAKFCYSYGKLQGGNSWYALQAMTGAKNIVVYYFHKATQRWKPKYLKEDWAKGQSENARGHRYNYKSWTFAQDILKTNEDLWETLKKYGTDKYLMGCNFSGANAEAKKKGIVVWHVYSVVHIMEESCDDGQVVRLIQLRNPWGRKDWTGDWGDRSSQWKENPLLHERLAPLMEGGGNDGKFFMCWEDWAKSFNEVTVCPIGFRVEVDGEQEEAQEAEDEEEQHEREFLESDDEGDWVAW
eukprot:CAMPEP_0181441794 /NCGR_PEP_ID=MMETSP1110-20121109/23692_1 /TAXON_ID=174948 /ORGANISM="Symbiodinium sp., Strain CCMP421" /LENGTH=538 /DNA_ID=CAMNT_0023565691 /DNA_START=31 /DNA_END=1647 /DNA_ORIENTATION=+